MLNEFKKFLFRGNVIDLAVGVVVGAAFTSLVNAIVADFLSPLIVAIAKVPDFSGYVFSIRGGNFALGHFLNTLISFVLVAFAVFFFVVRPVNILIARTKKDEAEVVKPTCPHCLSEIKAGATRCPFCTQEILIKE